MLKHLTSLLLFYVFCSQAGAQQTNYSPLFNAEDLLEITLIADFDQLLEVDEEEESFDFEEDDRMGEEPEEAEEVEKDDYHDGKLLYKDREGISHSMDIKLRTRGQFRLVYCDFPPLKFQFLPELTTGTPFEGQYKLKLVTHCEKNVEKFNHAIIHEYLLYKCYQVLSDQSFGVRMIKLNYQKSENADSKVSSHAFFIQSIDELASRLKAIEIEDPKYFANPPDVTPEHHLSFFQYMIGNNDWALPGHNCKMLRFADQSDTIAVPYDFDLAYLSRAHSFPLPEKEYKGGCLTDEEINTTVSYFNRKKDQIVNVYKDCKWLDKPSADNNIAYIEEFYQTINDSVKIRAEILKNCPY